MRVLLDECLPRILRKHLPSHEVRTTVDMGWNGLSNGALLRAARGRFDVLLTADKKLPSEADVARSGLALIVMHVPTTDANDLIPLMPAVLDALPRARPGDVLHVRR